MGATHVQARAPAGRLTFAAPAPGATFTITGAPAWPAVDFETDGAGPHTWEWQLAWRHYRASGRETTPDNRWSAGPAVADRGGTPTVRVTAGASAGTIAVRVDGTNPARADVADYVNRSPAAAGFDAIIAHGSRFVRFGRTGEPVVSFDHGYGLCQLTIPPPTFEQAWNWKCNVDAGLAVFAVKRGAAIAFLSQQGRSYSGDQLRRETVSRWNGGPYHEWNAATGAWVRRANVLCDTQTGNMAWDMTDAENARKSEAQLRGRDKAAYAKRPAPEAHWGYYGVWYADRLLG